MSAPTMAPNLAFALPATPTIPAPPTPPAPPTSPAHLTLVPPLFPL